MQINMKHQPSVMHVKLEGPSSWFHFIECSIVQRFCYSVKLANPRVAIWRVSHCRRSVGQWNKNGTVVTAFELRGSSHLLDLDVASSFSSSSCLALLGGSFCFFGSLCTKNNLFAFSTLSIHMKTQSPRPIEYVHIQTYRDFFSLPPSFGFLALAPRVFLPLSSNSSGGI